MRASSTTVNVDGKTSESVSLSRRVANEYARAWQKLVNAGEAGKAGE